jgi:hypothetical protein
MTDIFWIMLQAGFWNWIVARASLGKVITPPG